MTAEISESSVRCPIHGVELIYIPKPIAEDIVVCPECGAGGSYEEVVENGRGLIIRFIPQRALKELLKQVGSANSSIASNTSAASTL
jgi:nitrogen fixation protein